MVDHNKTKYLTMDISFRSFEELKNTLNTMQQYIKLGIENHKSRSDNSIVEYSMRYLEDIDCKEQVINGKNCVVIQSKINKM